MKTVVLYAVGQTTVEVYKYITLRVSGDVSNGDMAALAKDLVNAPGGWRRMYEHGPASLGVDAGTVEVADVEDPPEVEVGDDVDGVLVLDERGGWTIRWERERRRHEV